MRESLIAETPRDQVEDVLEAIGPRVKPVDMNQLLGQRIERCLSEYSPETGQYVRLHFVDGPVVLLMLSGFFVACEVARK